jgi:hypothetical protein
MGPKSRILCLVALVVMALAPSARATVEHPNFGGPPPFSPSLASSNAPTIVSSGSHTVWIKVHVD